MVVSSWFPVDFPIDSSEVVDQVIVHLQVMAHKIQDIQALVIPMTGGPMMSTVVSH